ncbi:MAG: hypothetical protein WC346_19490 [Methanogenium sp.]|jgi:hypothetical protein|nr:hypothetical protein [Spirochaetota bacterium]
MYLTATEYNTYTGRPSSEATTLLIRQACKLLDSRIGNHGIYSNGYKIDTTNSTWYVDNYYIVTTDQKEAVKMWVASMIQEMVINGTTVNNIKGVSLGRFSVQKGSSSSNQILPSSMGYIDSILISSGIIKRELMIK